MTDYDITAGLSPEELERLIAAHDRYHAACHAMQSGVAWEMNTTNAHEPKHLRVGVNSALVESGEIVRLLIEKGLLTWPEWFERLADGMEREVAQYEGRAGVTFA